MIKYYLAIKRNEILIYTVTWMDSENIIPRKISHEHKDKY